MISEVANALLLTYLFSEYLIAAHDQQPASRRTVTTPAVLERNISKTTLCLTMTTVGINILDRVTGAQDFVNRFLFQGVLLHLPLRAILAAMAYVLALYVDVTYRHRVSISWKAFLPRVGWKFCSVLPLYPILAVLISFVFLFVINLWEALKLPLEWLNAPIYYCTLYGPFAYVYLEVKQSMLQERTCLPI